MADTVQQKRLGPGTFLLLIIMLGCFAPISTDMYLPALGTMVDEFGTTESVMNITLYGFMLVLAFSMLVMGPVIDRFGRKGVLIACLAEYTVVTFACALVHNIHVLIALRLLQAFGSGGVMTISTAFVKDSYSGAAMSRVLNIVAVIGVLGPVAAPVIGAALIEAWGWRYTFVAPALFSLLCLFISLFVTETLPPEKRAAGGMKVLMGGMAGLFRNGPFMVFLIMICMFNLPFMAYLSVSSYIYEDTFGFSESGYSMMLAVALIIGIIVMTVINRLTAHVVNKKMIPLYFFMGLVGSVLMLAVGESSWELFLVAFLFIISASMTVRPWGMGVLMRSHHGDSGLVSSMINFMFFIIGTVGMMTSTIWSDYIFGLGITALAASFVYLGLYAALAKMGFSRISMLEGTPAGDDLP